MRTSGSINLGREMTERVMVGRQLDKWRKRVVTDGLGAGTPRRKRAAGPEMCDVWRQPRNLIQVLAHLARRVGHRREQSTRVRIARAGKQFHGGGLLHD